MIVKHFDIKTPQTQPPQDEGWGQTWAGYYAMTKCMSQERREQLEERDRAIRAAGEMTETDFGRDCLLSVLADIKREQVNMFELGAGWGRRWCHTRGPTWFRLLAPRRQVHESSVLLPMASSGAPWN